MKAIVTIEAEIDSDAYRNLVDQGYTRKDIERVITQAFARIPVTIFIDHQAPIFDYEVDSIQLQ